MPLSTNKMPLTVRMVYSATPDCRDCYKTTGPKRCQEKANEVYSQKLRTAPAETHSGHSMNECHGET